MNQTEAAGRADTSAAIHQDGRRGGGTRREGLGKVVFAPVNPILLAPAPRIPDYLASGDGVGAE